MKKMIVFLLAMLFIMILIACKTMSPPEEVVRDWVQAFEERDLDGVMAAYWPDANVVFIPEEGEESRTEGKAAIQEMQLGFLENVDASFHIDMGDLHGVMSENTITFQVIFIFSEETSFINRLSLVEREKRWSIVMQTVKPG